MSSGLLLLGVQRYRVAGGGGASAALTGTITSSIAESDIVAGGKTIILTLTGDTYVTDSATTPVIETADATESGDNNTTPTSPWSVSRPTLASGDMLILIIGWDDSTTNASISVANGPNSEVWQQINSVVASASTEVRMTAYYVVATGTWTAGSISVTPAATEQWTASVLKVPAGEFYSGNPIGASATSASAGTAETTVNSPALTAGATDGNGRMIWAATVDADPQSSLSAGWTAITNTDRGAVSLSVQSRDSAVTRSQSISAADGTRTVAGDSWCSLGFIVRAPISAFEDAVDELITGIDSAQSEAGGWDAKVKTDLTYAHIVRTSSTVTTITLPAVADYNITATETITATIPAAILTGASPIVASPTVDITAAGGGSFAFAQDNAAGDTGSATTVATTLTSVAADDLIAVYVTWNHATATASVGDGTNTADAATQTGSGVDTQAQWHYFLPGEHVTGSVTVTATFSLTSSLRAIHVFRITTTGTVAIDQQNAAEGADTSASSGNITTTGATSIVLGSVVGFNYSESPTDMAINSVSATANTVGPTINSVNTWFRIVSATFTGGASCTTDGGGDICNVINFTAI